MIWSLYLYGALFLLALGGTAMCYYGFKLIVLDGLVGAMEGSGVLRWLVFLLGCVLFPFITYGGLVYIAVQLWRGRHDKKVVWRTSAWS